MIFSENIIGLETFSRLRFAMSLQCSICRPLDQLLSFKFLNYSNSFSGFHCQIVRVTDNDSFSENVNYGPSLFHECFLAQKALLLYLIIIMYMYESIYMYQIFYP